jgi:hypothetical protein
VSTELTCVERRDGHTNGLGWRGGRHHGRFERWELSPAGTACAQSLSGRRKFALRIHASPIAYMQMAAKPKRPKIKVAAGLIGQTIVLKLTKVSATAIRSPSIDSLRSLVINRRLPLYTSDVYGGHL